MSLRSTSGGLIRRRSARRDTSPSVLLTFENARTDETRGVSKRDATGGRRSPSHRLLSILQDRRVRDRARPRGDQTFLSAFCRGATTLCAPARQGPVFPALLQQGRGSVLAVW